MKFGAKRKIKKAADNVTKARNNLVEEKMSPASDMVISDRRSSSGPIGQKEITEAVGILLKYKEGKVNLENRIIENEQWWKRRHWDKLRKNEEIAPASAWLFNCIMSKYADYMDAYPEPNILPREEGDKQEAKILTSIVPVVLEQNGFYKVYSNKSWKILKDGSAIYGIFWDGQKLNGLGDISIKNVDFLNLFWEPGIVDIQDSDNVFHVNLISNKKLETMYPELKGKLGNGTMTKAEYLYDDNVDVTDKSLLVEWYYKKWQNGHSVLHYVKFAGDTILYATENDTERPTMDVEQEMINPETGETMINPETGEPLYETVQEETGEESMAERGWYDHGMYPFVVETMFPVEGSLCGFSYIDICKEPQKYIDMLDQAVLKNALMNAMPRYFSKQTSTINETEFLDWTKPIVHVGGDISDLGIRKIDAPDMNGSAMTKINDKINEMKETTGNTDVARGNVGGGITSGSAISALQESAGKTSRSQNKMAYQAYSEVITMIIELIRQFYDVPRQFRILGKKGNEYVTYSNENLKPQAQGNEFDVDDGYRLPVFDVEVSAQKQNPYSKNSQNELALNLYGAGFFSPQNADIALACLDVMDFAHKTDVVSKIEGNAQLYNENIQLKQQLIQMAAMIDSEKGTTMAANLQQAFESEQLPNPQRSNIQLEEDSEHPFNERSREQANAATQVN
jgi:hypothetical protein|nr:MAG TPA: Portal protein [Caudoviricetes sp.]